MQDEQENPIHILVGRVLSSVEFVQDYIQLRFDGPCLTAITLPVLHTNHQTLRLGMPGYRDILCEHIGSTVNSVCLKKEEEISLQFADTTSISISLKPADYVGPEAASFTDGTDNIWVW